MDEASRNLLVTRWQATLQAVSRMRGRADPLLVEPPAAFDEVVVLEQRLGVVLPAALKDVLLTFSRRVNFAWFLPYDYKISEEFSGVFCGGCNWSFDSLVECDEGRERWATTVFPNLSDEYDAVWHGKLAFQEAGNGDCLAIDLGVEAPDTIVYLSHDYGDGHGRRLASDFQDLLLRWSRLGCIGAEAWQWMPFAPAGGHLDPDCDLARLFRHKLGVDI